MVFKSLNEVSWVGRALLLDLLRQTMKTVSRHGERAPIVAHLPPSHVKLRGRSAVRKVCSRSLFAFFNSRFPL